MTQKTKAKTKAKIIFLEDEKTLARLYTDKLEQAGFEVISYTDINTLIKDLDTLEADIAFLDYSLHGETMSGADIIPLVRESHLEIKIVMLSNYSEFQMEKEAKEAGADDYLLKINTPPAALVAYAKKLAG